MKALVLQEKGGVGKSYFCKLLYLLLYKKGKPFKVCDCDNASLSLSKFVSKTLSKLGPDQSMVEAEAIDFLNEKQKIDRSKFDIFLEELLNETKDTIVDFGAATSEQFLYYAMENRGMLDDLQDMGISIYVVTAGDTTWQDCFSFIKKIEAAGLLPLVKIVANEFQGGVGEKSVTELLQDLGLKPLTVPRIGDQGDAASQEWQDFMINGITLEDINELPLMRRRRVNNYLTTIFDQF